MTSIVFGVQTNSHSSSVVGPTAQTEFARGSWHPFGCLPVGAELVYALEPTSLGHHPRMHAVLRFRGRELQFVAGEGIDVGKPTSLPTHLGSGIWWRLFEKALVSANPQHHQ